MLINRILFLTFFILIFGVGQVAGEVTTPRAPGDVSSLDNARAIFDVRTKSPKALLFILKVAEQTRKEMVDKQVKTRFVLSFRGGTLPLLTADPKVESAADKAILSEVRERLTDMRKSGVKLEACNVAAGLFKIKKADLADSLTLVSNSLVSLVAYQNNGYALVPMY